MQCLDYPYITLMTLHILDASANFILYDGVRLGNEFKKVGTYQKYTGFPVLKHSHNIPIPIRACQQGKYGN